MNDLILWAAQPSTASIPCMIVSHNKSSPSSITSQNKSIQWNSQAKKKKHAEPIRHAFRFIRYIDHVRTHWNSWNVYEWMNEATVTAIEMLKITFAFFKTNWCLFSEIQNRVLWIGKEPKICCNSNNNSNIISHFRLGDVNVPQDYLMIERPLWNSARFLFLWFFLWEVSACFRSFNEWMSERMNDLLIGRETDAEEIEKEHDPCCLDIHTWRWSAHILRLNWQTIMPGCMELLLLLPFQLWLCYDRQRWM